MKYNISDAKQPEKINDILLLADRLAARNEDFIFCTEEGQFYIWQDNYFHRYHPLQFERYLLQEEETRQLNKHKRNELMHCLSIIRQYSLNEFNNFEILDLNNGIYDIKNDQLIPHEKEYLSTIRIPYDYDKNAVCPAWESFLEEALENKPSRINALQEFMGYCLGRDNKFHRALVLIGEGRNGKGTTFHIIRRIVGEKNGTSLTLQQMTSENMAAQLSNKLVNIDSDTNTNARNYEANFRRITGGDSIMVKNLYKDPFELFPHVKLIIGANDLPHISDKTHGFYDRLIIIPYNVSFFGKEDFNLKSKLETELSGILNWCLEGRRRLYKRGKFIETKEIKDMVQDLKIQNNPIEAYIHEHIAFKKDTMVKKKDLYAHYKSWCKSNGHYELSHIKFAKEFFRVCKDKTEKDAREGYGKREHVWPHIYIIGTGNYEDDMIIEEEMAWQE